MSDRLMGGARRSEQRAGDMPSSQTRVLRIPVRPIVMGGTRPAQMPMMGDPTMMAGQIGSPPQLQPMGPRMPGMMGGPRGMG